MYDATADDDIDTYSSQTNSPRGGIKTEIVKGRERVILLKQSRAGLRDQDDSLVTLHQDGSEADDPEVSAEYVKSVLD